MNDTSFLGSIWHLLSVWPQVRILHLSFFLFLMVDITSNLWGTVTEKPYGDYNYLVTTLSSSGPSPHPRGLSSHPLPGAHRHAPPPASLAPRSPLELQAVAPTKKPWPLEKGIAWGRPRSSGPQEPLICVFRTTAFSLKRGFRWKAMSLPPRRLMWNLGVRQLTWCSSAH